MLRNLGKLQLVNHLLGLEVLDSGEGAVEDVVDVGADPASHAGVHVVFGNLRVDVEGDAASEAGGDGEGLFREGDRVEAHDNRRLAQEALVIFEVVEEVIDHALFAPLDGDHDAGVGLVLSLTRLDREDGGEEGIAIVRRSTAVEPTILDDWLTRVGDPPVEEGLLVHVTVHKHALLLVLGRVEGVNGDDEEGRPLLINERMVLHALDLLLLQIAN
mmetsp:Transcript_18904/g.32274  ORF Transcript_18904/g.32274 Transcript_18904/m.32274 type:complete len:216 (+) Transcript_18904:692-1339(+)